jgi:hypothetical protein
MSDAPGYAASLAVLATFLMRSMAPLRLVALLSNVLFLTCGYSTPAAAARLKSLHPNRS